LHWVQGWTPATGHNKTAYSIISTDEEHNTGARTLSNGQHSWFVLRESRVRILIWRLKPLWICSVCPGNCQKMYLTSRSCHKRFLPHPFQFIIHYHPTTRICTLSN